MLYIYTGIKQLSKWGGGWLELGFSLLEWKATDEQEGKARMDYVVLEYQYEFVFILKYIDGGCPSGTVVENLPANARDTGPSPGPGRSHMLRSS